MARDVNRGMTTKRRVVAFKDATFKGCFPARDVDMIVSKDTIDKQGGQIRFNDGSWSRPLNFPNIGCSLKDTFVKDGHRLSGRRASRWLSGRHAAGSIVRDPSKSDSQKLGRTIQSTFKNAIVAGQTMVAALNRVYVDALEKIRN